MDLNHVRLAEKAIAKPRSSIPNIQRPRTKAEEYPISPNRRASKPKTNTVGRGGTRCSENEVGGGTIQSTASVVKHAERLGSERSWSVESGSR